MRAFHELRKKSVLCMLFCCVGLLSLVFAQDRNTYYKASASVLSGRVAELSADTSFGRLPARLKQEVREPLWNLGRNSAGIYIDFRTTSENITVRYQLDGALNMPHMPTTGVSGVDLYLKENNDWSWAFGNYQFGDTVKYNFRHIGNNSAGVYRLYLPLYNSVKWLEIGVDKEADFSFLGKTKDKQPIVVYGTSIAQGACVSRPGMAWTNIVGRALDKEVINLAFSGNGRLEQPILSLMQQEEASVFILDCLPNLAITPERSEATLDSLVIHAVQLIRFKHPLTPIVLAGHSTAYTPGFLNQNTKATYEQSTEIGRRAVARLIEQGDANLHWLDSRAMGLDISSTVDYAHPNDYGMHKIAEAYTQLLSDILK